jgi:hypothetical protein
MVIVNLLSGGRRGRRRSPQLSDQRPLALADELISAISVHVKSHDAFEGSEAFRMGPYSLPA